MDRQRVLKEAQAIASNYSFWMVSGDISHLYGRAYETSDIKYELEIKFSDEFPQAPPKFQYHEKIKELLGDIKLATLHNWTPTSKVVDAIDELKIQIQKALNIPIEPSEAKQETPETRPAHDQEISPVEHEPSSEDLPQPDSEQDYITPDLNAYPPEEEIPYLTPDTSGDNLFYDDSTEMDSQTPTTPQPAPSSAPPSASTSSSETSDDEEYLTPTQPTEDFEEYQSEYSPEEMFMDSDTNTLAVNTELGLIQQTYAYDQKGTSPADIVIYLTITLTKTFLINIDFSKYPKRPDIIFPGEIRKLIGEPYNSLQTLKNWKKKSPPHVVDVLHELEQKLFTIKTIEDQLTKIFQEYQYERIPNDLTKVRIHLLTYGFEEYQMDIDLEPYPNPPLVEFSQPLQELIRNNPSELESIKNWTNNESSPIEVIREISWLVDKNSRINFELDLLKEHYQNINYDPLTDTLRVDMKGKMKTEDLTFEFKIELPRDYPMSVPKISVINEFDLESHEKTKTDLHASFEDFFDEWTPYSYLVDLFNLVSKKIFEVSVVSCVICHKIDCPTCSLKIAGPDKETCHVACPSCDRVYHKHCWDQTIKSFGKCGFCLKVPPPHMMP